MLGLIRGLAKRSLETGCLITGIATTTIVSTFLSGIKDAEFATSGDQCALAVV